MNLKTFIDEAINRGEKIKAEVLSEILQSKTIQEIVTNKNFISAVSRMLETKDEVKKVIGRQVKMVFDMMDVPTKNDLLRIGGQVANLERIVEKVGRSQIAVKVLPKLGFSTTAKKKSTRSRVSSMSRTATKTKKKSTRRA
jgi:uncharacterized transporter YbjL